MACGLQECVLTQHLFFLEKKSIIHVVFSYDLVQWIYAGHDQKAEVISHSESVSQDLSSFF